MQMPDARNSLKFYSISGNHSNNVFVLFVGCNVLVYNIVYRNTMD